MDEPFQAVQKFTRVDKRKYNSNQNRNKIVSGSATRYHSSFETNYNGNLYLLVNGGSFSCSGIVSWVLKKMKRATLIGIETGGSAYTLVGSPDKEITLPNTKIQVTIPTLQFVLQEYEGKKKTGVLPDVNIKPKISDLINNIDTEYRHTLEMINN